MGNRLEPLQAAHLFVEKHFPDCHGALLAGSVIRNQATETSDLDLVIFDDVSSSFRKSVVDFDWPIEMFVHSMQTYKTFLDGDCKRARPSLPRMISEGIIIKDTGVIQSIQAEAKDLLKAGPEKWTEDIIEMKRYFITDTLDDFIGSTNHTEDLFIANALAEQLSEFILRVNNQWIGTSKWVIRSLKEFDEAFTSEFVAAFDSFYKTGAKGQVIRLTERILKPYGGLLFEGFYLASN
ncbi:nucleotidyltransferase domain-containing protein [Bacillus sp. AGMB 02131]|uniref:Nucleotidyltransferase domain-containing protein n=2 Tax=Peribacillus faecalis TaxID=2772559 RepID=A0A927HC19_9BACI|nr:nucleotidyltransferase domain-containing protein [Peribacillus faecalis]